MLFTHNTAVYLESSPCSHLYNVSKIAALSRYVLKCHQVPHNAQELHHWLCRAALSASSVTPESLHGLPAEIGADSGSCDVLQVGLKPA